MKDPHAWHKNENTENENKPICAYQNVSVNGSCQVQTIINNGIVLTEINNGIVKTTIVYNNNTTLISEFNTSKQTIKTRAYNGTTLRYETETRALDDEHIYFQQIDRTISPPITKNIDTSKYYNSIEMDDKFINEYQLIGPLSALTGITLLTTFLTYLATTLSSDKFSINFHPPTWRISATMNNRYNPAYNGEITKQIAYYGTSTPKQIDSVLLNIKVPRPNKGADGQKKKAK